MIMELVERAGFLTALHANFDAIAPGEGHCLLISGEAGIGKTSLVISFCKAKRGQCRVLEGCCDALYTPRLLAPLYDIALQMQSVLVKEWESHDRTTLFSRLFHELGDERKPVIVIFEDVHWADEATLDFIKFVARRISLTKIMFILTYRDNEIHPRHPLRGVLGQLPPDSFTRIQVPPLSRRAVEEMAAAKGYKGEDVYAITGGIPFYVNEILASYSPGVPENIKDSILAIYDRHPEDTRRIWTILSVLPTGIDLAYLGKMEPAYREAIEDCVGMGILVIEHNEIRFKHELYRRTIEASLSSLKRLELNREILRFLRTDFEHSGEIERIVHHAKDSNDYETVLQYAPIAAEAAAKVGAHIEAAKLYYTAIEYYRESDKYRLIGLYELYAYECYLINKHKDAIIYTQLSLELWRQRKELEKMANCLRFLSRLWWFEGNRQHAEDLGAQAIEVLEKRPSSKAKAKAYSNMAQLRMSMDRSAECIEWAKKAIGIAKEINDEEIVVHALNSMGSALMLDESSRDEGIRLLSESLGVSLKNAYHEHVARAYIILGANGVTVKNYPLAGKALAEGMLYCEEHDLDASKLYMQSSLARLHLETGNWAEAGEIAGSLLKNEGLLPVIRVVALTVLATVRMKRGGEDVMTLIDEAKAIAYEAMELQRIIPTFLAMMEYEWITGKKVVDDDALADALATITRLRKFRKKSRLYFWLRKTGKEHLFPVGGYEDGGENYTGDIVKDVGLWKEWGCPYEEALSLFEGNEKDKRKAIEMISALGGTAVYEKLKRDMRVSGIKNLPRGKRKSTLANVAHLTGRELDVLQLLKEGLKNREIAGKLFISSKTVDHHISAILFKLEADTRAKAVNEAIHRGILKHTGPVKG